MLRQTGPQAGSGGRRGGVCLLLGGATGRPEQEPADHDLEGSGWIRTYGILLFGEPGLDMSG